MRIIRKMAALTMAGIMAVTAASPVAMQADEKIDYKIAFILTSGKLGDKAANDASYAGVQLFCEETGAEVKPVELAELQDIDAAVRSYVAGGYDLIIFNNPDASEAAPVLAEEFPDVQFALIEGTSSEVPNLVNVQTTIQQAGFVCGAFAALMNEELTGKKLCGFIGGVRNPNLERSQYGFTAGAEYVGGECTSVYVGNFTDAAAAKELTNQMFGNDIRVVQAWAGGANTGVFEAALNAGEGYYSMGGATGQFDLSDSIIASQVKNSDEILYQLCRQAYEGTLLSGTMTLGLAEDAVGIKYAPEGRDAAVTDAIREQVAEIAEKVASGEIHAPSTEAEFAEFESTLG